MDELNIGAETKAADCALSNFKVEWERFNPDTERDGCGMLIPSLIHFVLSPTNPIPQHTPIVRDMFSPSLLGEVELRRPQVIQGL